MKFEDIGSRWLKDAVYRNSKLTKDELRKAIIKLNNFKGKLDTAYITFDLIEQHEDEIISHKIVSAFQIDGIFYIPTINYIKC